MFKEQEPLPAVNNELLTPEHKTYCMAWHTKLGDQKNIVYTGMGPDVSTISLFANPLLIIGVDLKGLLGRNLLDYKDKYWDIIDKKPVSRAGESGAGFVETPQNYQPSIGDWGLFLTDLRDRKERGYWDYGAINRWGNDRLLMIELKKIGVRPETISISAVDDRTTEIVYDWAYPGQKPEKRKIIYFNGTVTDLLAEQAGAIEESIDCYYQKSIPKQDITLPLVRQIAPLLRGRSIVAVGHLFKNYGNNEVYRREIGEALGAEYVPLKLDRSFDALIDGLSKDGDPYGTTAYGMKLHVFRKK